MCTGVEENRQTGIVYFFITDGKEDRHIQTNCIHVYCTFSKDLVQEERRAKILELDGFGSNFDKELVYKERRTNTLELDSFLLQTERRTDTFRQIVHFCLALLIKI